MPSALRRRTRTPLVRWAAGAAACALALTPLAWGTDARAQQLPDAGAEAPTEDPTASPRVVIDEVSPWMERDGALTVTGRIVNPTSADFSPSRVDLVRSSNRLAMRDDVNDWVEQQTATVLLASSDDEPPEPPDDTGDGQDDEGDEDSDEPTLEVPDLPTTIEPGEQTEFTFTIPADQFGTSGSAVSTWGAYGLGAALRGTAAAEPENPAGAGTSSVLATAPAFTVWHPDPGIDRTEVTTVLPITLDATDTDGGPLIEPELLEQAADADATGDYAGALRRAVTAADTLPESVLAVDPRLLASVTAALDLAAEADEGAGDQGGSDGADGLGESGEGDEPQEDTGNGEDPSQDAPADNDAPRPGADVQTPDPAEDDSGGAGGEGDGTTAPDGAGDLPTAPSDEVQESYPHLTQWYEDFTALAHDREIVALPWADAHLTSLWHSDMSALTQMAMEERELVESTLGGSTDVLWPASGTVHAEDLDAIAEAGAETVILSDTQQPSLTWYTSSANSAVSVDGARPQPGAAEDPTDGASAGEQTVLRTLVADSGLSEAAAAHSTGDSAAPGQFLALSAAVTAERPFDSRSLLLTLPRTAAGTGLADLADELAGAPWVNGAALDQLMDTEPVARGPLVEMPEVAGTHASDAEPEAGVPGAGGTDADRSGGGPGELGAEADAHAGKQAADASTYLASLQEQYTAGTEASHAFADAEAARRDMARTLLVCTGTGVIEADRADTCTEHATGWVDRIAEGVRPEPGSSVLLVTGEQAMIPVRIENSTDRTARVRLHVESPTPQLSTEVSDIVTLGPEESRSVDVPVRGLANADVNSTVRLLTVDGDVLPQNTELLIRVRADWENTATIAIGSALALVLVGGLFRTFRRGRRKIPKNQLDAAVARAEDG
ncbi:DUF6049 family protein [Brevibacterium jeotgali]|uniref:Secreted protein n=1 Tax=Brevibacterium jeotgali TaxID=1262550 RepID=A0A2H1L4V9_9MICO|nr:DUF6049 family protein [Brevibacterium jeotgali]TWC01453.1 hypothetical protein FB108_0097 [Brevibacterium jeotgali]SMY11941.1 hypothetical protein BJEO58_01535 [Brevibacterium jeotgali]